jgi:hypothetical protein
MKSRLPLLLLAFARDFVSDHLAIPDTSPGATRSAGSSDSGNKPLTAQHVRFTTKGDALYAFVMAWPESCAAIIKGLLA